MNELAYTFITQLVVSRPPFDNMYYTSPILSVYPVVEHKLAPLRETRS